MNQFNNEKAYAVFSSFKDKFYKGKKGNSGKYLDFILYVI